MFNSWKKIVRGFSIFFFFLIVLQGSGKAESFPFRNVAPGDESPPLIFHDAKTGQEYTLAQQKGHPLVVLFWGADMESKKKRSIMALAGLKELHPFLEKRNITVLSVNAQSDDQLTIDAVVKESAATFPTLLDQDQQVYGDLGIFVMPSVLLVDKDKKIINGMGYSHDMTERLKGEIEIMLGEKTKEQVKAELHPEMIEKSKEEKASRRHLNMGRVMLDQGIPERAIDELKKAITLYPKSAEAHIELGCIYVETGNFEDADKELGAGLELDPESIKGQICDARLTAISGELDTAIEDLQALMMRNARNPLLHYTLGNLYDEKKDAAKAAESYRKAFELLNKRNGK